MVSITNAGDNRIFITLQSGLVMIYDGTRVLPEPFLDVRGLISTGGGSAGLLSIAFHPHYAQNGLFFVKLHQPRRQHGGSALFGLAAGSQSRQHDVGPPRCSPSPSRSKTITADSCSSALTAFCTSAWGDGGSGGRSRQSRPEPRRAPRKVVAHRRRRRLPLRHPAVQSLPQHARCPSGDLGSRPAQSMALLLRPRFRRSLDRGRRPGHVGRDRRFNRPPASAAKITAGGGWKGRTASTRPATAIPARSSAGHRVQPFRAAPVR